MSYERELSELLTPSIHQKANTNCHRLSFIHMFVQVFYHCHFDWHLDQLWSGTIQCLFTREASTSIFEGPKGTQVIDWPCHQRQWSLFCHWRNGLTRKFNLLTSLIDRFIIEATSYTEWYNCAVFAFLDASSHLHKRVCLCKNQIFGF